MPRKEKPPHRLLTIDSPPATVSVEGAGRSNVRLVIGSIILSLLTFGNYDGGNVRSWVRIRDTASDEILHQNGPYNWYVSQVFANEWAEAIQMFGVPDAIFRIKNGWRLTEPPPA